VDTTQNFYAPFSVDPGNGDRVLYGTTRVWETTNGGDAWTALSASGSNGFNSGGNNVDAIGIAPSDVNTLYAATGGTFASSSKIFVTINHGTAWTEHDLPAGSARVNDIQVDPANAQIAYAVVNNFSANGHVFRTTNGGTSWTNISGGGAGALPNLPVWSIQIDGSTTPSTLYVGADDGVYASTDLGVNWSRFGQGFPKAQAVQIALNNTVHVLGAATHGRGAWEIATNFSLSISPSSVTVPNGGGTATYTVTITRTGGFSSSVNLTVSGLPAGATDTFNPNPATSSSTLKVTVPSTSASGTYKLKVTGKGGTPVTKRIATAKLVKST
jgi:hypothetical protein